MSHISKIADCASMACVIGLAAEAAGTDAAALGCVRNTAHVLHDLLSDIAEQMVMEQKPTTKRAARGK